MRPRTAAIRKRAEAGNRFRELPLTGEAADVRCTDLTTGLMVWLGQICEKGRPKVGPFLKAAARRPAQYLKRETGFCARKMRLNQAR